MYHRLGGIVVDGDEVTTTHEPGVDDPTVVESAQAEAGASREGAERIGRYRVLEPLGAGGMGVVYLAYDVDLDRRVAVKLLRGSAGPVSTEGRSRLLREAQAMAKLAHPNVVNVFEVGEHEGEVFLAMEYVPGRELGDWLREGERDWREILGAFLQAGRGLAAAHALDMVHRDFKPANALVGEDGRVRVLDFGLARAIGVVEDAELFDSRFSEVGDEASVAADASGSEGGLLATPLTQVGLAMGTPAYMAPEQHFGQDVDARADQFAFCISLWEALYGERPFRGSTGRELAHAKSRGDIAEPTNRLAVPVRVRKALTRGLASRGEDRWPSMEALLEALAYDPSVARRRWLLGVGAAGLAGIAAWAGMQSNAPTCALAAAPISEVWNPERAASVESAIRATKLPFADRSWELVRTHLDAWSAEWTAGRIDACEATRIRAEQSDEAMDLRMQCYERRLRDLDARVEVLETVDAQSLEKIAASMNELPELAACEDPGALERGFEPPDSARAGAVADVRDALARAGALGTAGRYEPAIDVAADALARASELGYPPLEAEARYRLGFLQGQFGEYEPAEEALSEAYWSGLGLRHDELAFDAATALVHLVGISRGDLDGALRWARDAGAVGTRISIGGRRLAQLLHNEGNVLARKGSLDDARTTLEAALEIREALAPDSHLVAVTVIGLGTLAQRAGRMEEAVGHFEAARSMLERTLGPEHPSVAACWNNLGNVWRRDREFDRAHEAFEKALEIRERAHGPDSDYVGRVLMNIGTVYLEQERYAEAEAAYARAQPILEATLGPEDPNVAGMTMNRGAAALKQDEFAEARSYFEQAARGFERAFGPEHPVMVEVHAGLGEALRGEGALASALEAFDRANELLEKTPGDPAVHGRVRWLRARAIHESGDRRRALALVEDAREQLAGTGAAGRATLTELDAWLEQHG